MNIDIDEMRKNMITFQPIPIKECLEKHKGYYHISKDANMIYEVYCFACDTTRKFKQRDPPESGST